MRSRAGVEYAGRPRNDDRAVRAGIIYRLRTGCQAPGSGDVGWTFLIALPPIATSITSTPIMVEDHA
jgi:hypothetical protein